MVINIKNSAKVTVQVLGLSIAAFITFVIAMGIFGQIGETLITLNPIFSGFVHAGFDHILYNLLLIFLFTLPAINSQYDIRKIFWITFILSCAYLPITLLGITQSAIGISGTCYFLMSRFFFSNQGSLIRRVILHSLLAFLILGEYINMTKPTSDGVAHGVHFMGVALGIISIYIPHKLPKKIQEIIS
jgi:membrane associated rhomboid family serine protease